MRTLAEQWESFAKAVLPATAGPVQRKEMRRAFYAGASATLAVMTGVAGDDVSDQAGAAILEGLHDEQRRFAAEVAAGRA